MVKHFIKLVYFLLFFLPVILFGQQIKHLGVDAGISSGAVRAFEKDTLGYVWIGTSQGLIRYSGYKIKNYSTFLTNGVVGIISNRGKLLVLGAKGTLLSYQYEQDRFKKLLNLEGLKFLSFEQINERTLIIGLQKGLLIYDLTTEKLSKVLYSKTRFNRKIHVKKNQIYVASTAGINVYDYFEENNRLVKRKTFLSGIETLDFDFDQQNRIWVGTYQKGLFTIKNEVVKKVPLYDKRIKTYTVRSIAFDLDDKALIALEGSGLFIMDKDFNIINKLEYDPNNINSISQNSIYEIFVDEANVYWLGLREIGVDLVYPRNNAFKNVRYVPYKQNSIHNNNIRAIYYEDGGNSWFGTENGISKRSPQGKWTNYNTTPNLKNKAILTINSYGESFLLGVYGDGLIEFNPKTGKTAAFTLQPKALQSKLIFATYLNGEELWVGGIDGPVKHYQNKTLVKSYKTGNARSIISGEGDLMYVGSANGLFEINKATQRFKRIENKRFKRLDQIHSLFYDIPNNCLWIGNAEGLLNYNLKTQEIKWINSELNFESGTVFSIQKDREETLWLGSYSGLWKLNIKNNIIRKYDSSDGLGIETFGFGASTKSNEGRLAFGGPKGAVLFNPKDLPKEKQLSKIYISNFEVNGVKADSTIIAKNINFLDEIELDYSQNSLSFDFEAPTFHGSKKNTFSWQLKGYDKRPIVSKNSRKAIYSKLDPGAYTLEIKVINVRGIPSPNTYTIDIFINNPFWLSQWAFLGYMLLGSVLIYLILLANKVRIDQRFNENKIKFFTEVAHDIRTPISLIQQLVAQLSNKENLENNIQLIKRNTQNLNEYVTQLLDFQKAERKMLKLAVKQSDLKKIINRIVTEVQPLIEEKSIDIDVSIPKINLWFDEKKMVRIFYNLISNAIQYSEDGGQIEIKASVHKKVVKIDFIDNGLGIPEKEQKLIFSRFTRGTNINNKGIPGTGIGLMISKKFVELHGGQIELKSKENLGSTFTITLLKGSEHYNEDDLLIENIPTEKTDFIEDRLKTDKLILLVEDNFDLRTTIKNELEKKYTVIDAPNGKEALVMALAKNPDLIITDVMMPVMDGKELCNIIKTNFKTSHIPVIMISALGDVDDKIEGLEIGVDAYVEKPFNMKILKATVNNLIRSRQLLHQIISPKEGQKIAEKSPDESFLSKVVQIINDNHTNREFSIDLLSEKTGLSRSNLFRKLKGLTNMSPSDLVLKIKLNHASELLQTRKTMRISDVAYESGFNDPKYFSTLFKKTYGKTPKEYSEDF